MKANDLIETLQFYANQANYFGAPAPIYSDSGQRASKAIREFLSDEGCWWNDETGLSQSDIAILRDRIGNSIWDGIIHLGGIHTGVWLPWPGKSGNRIRDILRLYANRTDFRQSQWTTQ